MVLSAQVTNNYWHAKFLKRPTNEFECMNLNLLYSNQQHVLATYVAIFRVEKLEYGHN